MALAGTCCMRCRQEPCGTVSEQEEGQAGEGQGGMCSRVGKKQTHSPHVCAHTHTHRALLEEGLIGRQQENQGLRRRGRPTPVHLTCVCKLISKESENKPPSEERGAEVRSSSRVPRASPLCVLPSSPCCGACAGGRVRGPGRGWPRQAPQLCRAPGLADATRLARLVDTAEAPEPRREHPSTSER